MRDAKSSSPRDRWIVIAVVLVAAATAFYRLGAKGLWGDEVWQVSWAQQQDVARTFSRFLAPPDFPLHFLLVKLSTALSSSPFWVRLPSAVFSVASVVTLFLLGRRAFGLATGGIAGLLLAVAPFHVWYAQDARPYAALTCYSLLSLYFLWDLIETSSRRAWIGFALATILNLYNQFFAIEVLAAECIGAIVIVWMRPRRWPSIGRIASAVVLALLAAAPLWPGTVRFLLAGSPGEVEAQPFRVWPTIVDLAGLFGAGSGLPLILFGVLFVTGVIAAIRRRRPFWPLAIAWLAMPFVALAILQPRHLFIPRHVLFLQPIYILLVAHGLVWVFGQWRRTAPRPGTLFQRVGVSAILLMTFLPTWQGYWLEKRNDWSGLCGYFHRMAGPMDAITGDAYIVGIMQWCYANEPRPIVIEPGAVPLERAAERGLSIWYVHTDPGVDMSYVRQRFTAIDKDRWATVGLRASSNFPFPQAEQPASLFTLQTTPAPYIEFHDVRGHGPVDYVQIPPHKDVVVRLRAQPSARELRITLRDQDERNVDVVVNGRAIAHIGNGVETGRWDTLTFPISAGTSDTIVLDLVNHARSVAVSRVEVR